MSPINRRTALGTGLVSLASPSFAAAATSDPLAPALTFVTRLRIEIAPAIEQGRVDGKRKRFIPITGGTIDGPRLKGKVLSGGGDWQAIHDDGLTEIYARYTLQAEDGTTIAITNPGVRVASPDVVRRIAAGEDVPADQYYFRATPTFEVADGPHGWLRRRVFVARGVRKPDHVLMDVYEVG